jgi:NAD(P)-dependent dehydrogenase (short-subunit alcohol dehydrogenase family)
MTATRSRLKTRFEPKGSVCVVTGAASGIGRELCIELARQGARGIIAVDIDLQGCEETCSLIATTAVSPDNNYARTLALGCDASSEADIRKIIARSELKFGKIDCFMCNAGILTLGGVDTSNEEWERIIRVNVMQSIYVARHMVPRWKSQGGGAMLITASAAGLLTQIGGFPYAVSKHAAVAVAEWIAVTHGVEDNIHVSCLCPEAVVSEPGARQ